MHLNPIHNIAILSHICLRLCSTLFYFNKFMTIISRASKIIIIFKSQSLTQ